MSTTCKPKTGTRDIVGYEGIYSIDDTGKVYSYRREIYIRPHQKNGYLAVHLNLNYKTKNCYVHRLVAEAFISNPENKKDINHKDGNRFNNNLSNLEWATRSENMVHARDVLHTLLLGEDNHANKLTLSQVLEIRSLGTQPIPHQQIANKYNVSRRLIGQIIKKQRWKYV